MGGFCGGAAEGWAQEWRGGKAGRHSWGLGRGIGAGERLLLLLLLLLLLGRLLGVEEQMGVGETLSRGSSAGILKGLAFECLEYAKIAVTEGAADVSLSRS